MPRFWRSKQLVSLCVEDQQQSIHHLAMELEEESSSILFPSPPPPAPSIIIPAVDEGKHADVGMSTFTDLTNMICTTNAELASGITDTTQSLITTTTANISITSDSCLEIQNDNEANITNTPVPANVMLQLNEQTGYFEPLFEKENICTSIPQNEEEVALSENKKERRIKN
ncbi:unnamed protein product [Parnassius apollo]|uniref:(apollo) hypothetical protein n=1 Tax=Parnassius apollo TaxID=110799 RepID=A0A8S3WCJ3_PARAO|nr:unnamed protein product [Parnassius apollo]